MRFFFWGGFCFLVCFVFGFLKGLCYVGWVIGGRFLGLLWVMIFVVRIEFLWVIIVCVFVVYWIFIERRF